MQASTARQKSQSTSSLRSSTLDDIEAAVEWVQANQCQVPPFVHRALMVSGTLSREISDLKQRKSQILTLLRERMGILPTSEKGVNALPAKAPLTDEEKLAQLEGRRKKLNRQIARYKARLGRPRRGSKRNKEEAAEDSASSKSLPSAKTSETASNPPESLALVHSQEQLFGARVVDVLQTEQKRVEIDRMQTFTTARGLHTSSDERSRYEFAVTAKKINLTVETVTDLKTGRSVTASTDEYGPPNTQATWTAIANTIVMVIGYAVPVNRLAKMLEPTCPYFTSSRLCFFLKYAAELFAPIYEHLGMALADASWLLGDDTKARVIEIEAKLKQDGSLDPPPDGGLISRMAEQFGRVFPRKRGVGSKKQLNVSAVIGKTVEWDPRSYVFFFRTHLGSLGDLLTKILETRNPKNKDLTLVGDLASTNLVSPELEKKFNIKRAGCGAHARRPFFRYRSQDVDICYWMLSAFFVLSDIEDRIDEVGRTEATTNRFRQKFAKKVWEAILKRCRSVLAGEATYGQRWPKGSKIYEAARYVVDNYKYLTAYLSDPRLPYTNNLSERVLRWDKIMQDASKFRKTELGRLNVDILRTIVHTCSAAEVDLKDYLFFVFKNREVIESAPEKFTPYAFALMQKIVNEAALSH